MNKWINNHTCSFESFSSDREPTVNVFSVVFEQNYFMDSVPCGA